MAGCDYVKCGKCTERLFYDGDVTVRKVLTTGLTCDKCVGKLEKKIKVLKKHDRRRH